MMAAAKKLYLFAKIHSFNYPLARFLSRRGEVASRIVDLPKNRTSYFTLLEYDDPDDWVESLEKAHEAAREFATDSKNWFMKVRTKCGEVDLSRPLLQRLIPELEGNVQTAELAKRYSQKINVPIIWVSNWPLTRFLDRMREVLTVDLKILASLVRNVLFPSPSQLRLPLEQIRAVIRGVAPSELADGPRQLDFSWWTRQGLLPREATVYILPFEPESSSQSYLTGHHWISEKSLGHFLSFSERVRCSLKMMGAFLWRNPLDSKSSQRFALKARCLPWSIAMSKMKLSHWVSSLGESWPELPEVCIAQSLGVRTVNWAYAGSNFGFTRRLNPYRDLAIWRSVICADEAWTWNDAHSDILRARQILPLESRQILSIGPMMCGDSELLSLGGSPQKAREQFGLSDKGFLYLAVFDIPVYFKEIRGRAGEGPYSTLLAQESLYQACIHLLERFPKLKLLIKQKRGKSPVFEIPAGLHELLRTGSKFSGRVHFLESKVDTYAVLAMSDFCLAAPYTSPIILAKMIGKPAWYYDDSGPALHSYQGIFDTITLSDRETLTRSFAETYDSLLKAPELSNIPSQQGLELSRSMKAKIKLRLGS